MILTVTQYHYLMTIHRLSQEMEEVHCIDLAIALGVARATISRMIKYLMDQGFVLRKGRVLTITKNGYQAMKQASQQYDIFYDYFSSLDLSGEQAKECTEALANHLSIQTFQKLCVLLNKKVR